MVEARARRVGAMHEMLAGASPAEVRALASVTDLLERVLR